MPWTPSLSVLVCRGCCCGTTSKHPDVDHDGQLDQLRAALPVDMRSSLYEVDCLGECASSNVIVVRVGRSRRWFGQVLDGDDTRAIADWIRTGALGAAPPLVGARSFEPQEP